MRLDGPESQNVEDRRGGGFPGGGGLKIGGGIGGIVILLVAAFFGVDLSGLVDDGSAPRSPPAIERRADIPARGAQPGTQPGAQSGAQSDPGRRFVAQVLGETERVWTEQFSRVGRSYQQPQLVLFSGTTQSGCGFAQAQVGPFYCPADQKVYIDLDFMAQLQQRLGARGDFAAAYIIAHEVGHHVQNQLGILRRADAARQRGDQALSNQVQVRIELQADCLAGVWANNAQRSRNILEDGDIEEGLNAAAAVGDDRLQGRAGGTVQPESFTHGSSAQRVRWFRRGLQSGDVNACDTFGD